MADDDAVDVTLVSSDTARGAIERGRSFERGQAIGRYVVLDRVGEGGMGVVYAAYDPELDRRLALKLLHHGIGERAEARRVRLVREAQAMARLSHRNVIVVHDVGTFDDQVFVAMEFIEGRSLGAWMAERPDWRAALNVLVQAGHGLAAAHAAGLVHRDFKPDNVMIAHDGRVVVTDFGLARAANVDDSGSERLAVASPAGTGRAALAATVTAAGAIMGTPAYMAPEQHLGQGADARADQFAFAVVLWEAIYRQRPFPGDDVASLAYHVTAGNLREPPAQPSVPGWLPRALTRALSVEPAQRFADMGALLHELTRDRAWRPRWWGIAAGVGAAAITGVYAGFVLDREPAPCASAREHVTAVWNGEREQTVEQRFAASGLSYAREQWPVLLAELRRYAEQWSAAYVDACEATHVRGEQSEALLDARMLCLARRLDEFDALLTVFEQADVAVVERSLAAVQNLPRLRACAQLEALLDPVPPPDDPSVAVELEDLRPELARVSALQRAGLYEVAIGPARDLVARADELGYDPLHAEALEQLAQCEAARSETAAAEQHLREAVTTAVRGRSDRVAGRAAVALVSLLAGDPMRRSEAEGWAELAQSLLSRTGGDDELEIELAQRRAQMLRAAGDVLGARAQLERVLAVLERTHGTEDARVADAAVELAEVLAGAGELAAAQALLHRALEIDEYAFGFDHPRTAMVLARLGAVAMEQGDIAAALDDLERAVSSAELAHGRDAPELVAPLLDAGLALAQLGRHDDAARMLARADTIARVHGEVSPALLDVGIAQYEAALLRDDAAGALEHARAAQDALGARTPDARHAAALDVVTAEALLHFDRNDEALARAQSLLQREAGPDTVGLVARARALWVTAQVHERRGAIAPAVDALEQSLACCDDATVPGLLRARATFELARLLGDAAESRARAEQLSRDALDRLPQGEERAEALRARIVAWRAAQVDPPTRAPRPSQR